MSLAALTAALHSFSYFSSLAKMFYCKCDGNVPAVPFRGRDGKLKYRCSFNGKCKLFANSFVRVDGYERYYPKFDRDGKLVPEPVVVLEACMLSSDSPLCSGSGLGIIAKTHSSSATLQLALSDPSLRGVVLSELDPKTPGSTFAVQFSWMSRERLAQELHFLSTTQHQRVIVCDIPKFFERAFDAMEGAYNEYQRSPTHRLDAEDSDVVQQLKPYQRRGVEFILEHRGRAMIADEMGLGKTLQAIAACHAYRDEWPLLIVCPVSLMENWAREVSQWLGIARSRIATLQGTKGKSSQPDLSVHCVVIVAYSSLACLEGAAQYDVVILDESHFVKNHEAKRTQMAVQVATRAKRLVLLSGTPTMSRPAELYTQMYMLHPTMFLSKSQFESRYCNAYYDDFGYHANGHSHLSELSALLKHSIIRRTKANVLAELPAKTRQILYVSVTAKEKKAMEADLQALRASTAGSNGLGGLSTRGPNAFDLKLATAKAKIPAVKDYVRDLVEGTIVPTQEKVIIFAHYQLLLLAIEEAVKSVTPRTPIDYIVISGDTPIHEREQLADHFRNDPKCHVAVLSMQSCGTGHNFTCASMVVFAELDWTPSTHLQCEDRVHRIGQQQACTVQYLLAEGTSDSVVWPLLQTKMTVTSALLDGNSGQFGAVSGNASGGATALTGVEEEVKRHDAPPEKKQRTLDMFFSSKAVSETSDPDVCQTLPSMVKSTNSGCAPLPTQKSQLDAVKVVSIDAASPLPSSAPISPPAAQTVSQGRMVYGTKFSLSLSQPLESSMQPSQSGIVSGDCDVGRSPAILLPRQETQEVSPPPKILGASVQVATSVAAAAQYRASRTPFLFPNLDGARSSERRLDQEDLQGATTSKRPRCEEVIEL